MPSDGMGMRIHHETSGDEGNAFLDSSLQGLK